MELIQATQVPLVLQEGTTAAWNNNSILLYYRPLLSAAPYPPLPSISQPEESLIFNSSCLNSTKSTPTSLPGLAGIFIPLIYGIVCIVGLLGNTLVIHVIVNYTKNESVTNIYILNLAIADELFMLGLPFLAVQNALLSWPFGSLMCRVVMTVDAFNQFTSIFCLTVMSVDRYLAVVHPIRASWWRRPHVAKAISATVWLVSFVVVLPVVVFANVLKDDGNCSIVWPEPAEVWKTSFIVYTCTVGFFCPLLVISLCYLLIIVKVRPFPKFLRSFKYPLLYVLLDLVKNVGRRTQTTSSRRRRSERKITRMVVVVVAVFVFCWLPFYALNILNLLVVLPGDFRGLYYFVVVLSYANSCANPILYGFLSDNFKRGFRKALCRASRKVKNNEKAGTEVQRPTEEWGGIILLSQKRITNTHGKYCGENDVLEEVVGAEGGLQMRERSRLSHKGQNSKAEDDGKSPVMQKANPEPTPGDDALEVAHCKANKSRNRNSQTEEATDKNSVLDISYL